MPKPAIFLFGFNCHNYAQPITKYHENIMFVDTSHPEVEDKFCRVCFSLKKIKKCFSARPKNLVQEQKINADADSQRTCMSSIVIIVMLHFPAKRISVVFDKILTLSVKDSERDSQGYGLGRDKHMKYLVLFRNSPQILLGFFVTMDAKKH